MQEKKQKKVHQFTTRMMLYWLGITLVFLLLVTATYTWFSLSRTPRVNDLDLFVTTPAGLEIALNYDDPDEEWGQELSFTDMVTEVTPLKPCTWSDREQRLFAAVYGADGRLTGEWTPLSDEVNANTEGPDGYYTYGTLYARSDLSVDVSLSEAFTDEDGVSSSGTYLIGTPVWNQQELVHDDGGSGAEFAIRIGIRVTPIDPVTGEDKGDSIFYLYEPNCDGHVDGSNGYLATLSIDGGEGLVPAERLITQTTTSWTETYPVQRTATFRQMGEFTSQVTLFHLEKGEKVRLDVYLWLEGQDVDCTNAIGYEAQVLACLQFKGDYSGQTALEPIR